MDKFYAVKKTINGVEYTAQFNGMSSAVQAVDNSYIDGSPNTSVEKMSNYVLSHSIVEPKKNINDFGADVIGKTETKTIGGIEITAKFDGMLTAVKAIDSTYIDGTSNTSTEKLAKYLFEHNVVSPKNLSIDDFETADDFNEAVSFVREALQGWGEMDKFNEVISFGREVMQGNFRDKAEKSKSAKKDS